MKEIRFSFDDDYEIKKADSEAVNEIKEDEIPEISDKDISDGTEPEEEEEEISQDSQEEDVLSEEESEEYEDEDEYEDEEYDEDYEDIPVIKRKKIHSKKSVLMKIIYALIIVSGAVLIVLVSPLFSVKNIEVNELYYFSEEEICSMIGLETGDNGILFNKSKAEKKLSKNDKINSAEIYFNAPHTIVINVNENRIYGYIPYLSSYLYIDKDGRVLEIKNETEENLPIIEGLRFDSFTQGQIISVKNEDAMDTALIISKAMMKYNMLDKKLRINVADSSSIYAYIDNIKVLLGDTSRMEEKIKTLAEAIKEIPEGDRGTLDMQDMDKPIIFKYST